MAEIGRPLRKYEVVEPSIPHVPQPEPREAPVREKETVPEREYEKVGV